MLAAGGSRRLGTPKQLLRYRMRPLLVRAVAAARTALPRAPLVVVIGAHALRLRLVLRRAEPGARIVTNSSWRDGMATSLRAGLVAVPRTKRAVLVLLVDQPRVDAAAIERLVTAWRRHPGRLAAARYDGRAGVPAILPHRYWRTAKALQGDRGARALLRDAQNPTLVEMPEAALDIDTPSDVDAMRRAGRDAVATQLTQPVPRLA